MDTQAQINALTEQVKELTQRLNQLSDSQKIPLEVQRAFFARLGLNKAVVKTGTGTADTRNINLTGEAQTITVPAQPSGTIALLIDGQTYEFLYA